jgi:hypothetical protein
MARWFNGLDLVVDSIGPRTGRNMATLVARFTYKCIISFI